MHPIAQGAYAPRRTRPIWLQIYDRLLHACETGALSPGQRLPGEISLARTFDVSRVTLRRALRRLQQEGHLQARKGAGVYVRQPLTRWQVDDSGQQLPARTADARAMETRTLSLAKGPPDAATAEHLEIAPDAKVWHLTRLRLHKGVPIYLSDKFFPADIFDRFDAAYAPAQSVQDVFAAHGQADWQRTETRISGAFATAETAAALELSPSTPLIAVEAYNTARNGRRIELTQGIWPLTGVELVFQRS
ncbi:GntR family transcriptional regulator [Roseobacter sinensis]|uniref:GntR family transcriptional regulator n=1 Tax=Roseobacter sinensis TaxID=2931391 RepID=A0ABT3BGW7_9RHOB|nr:GntR family transcriptional regulator [Roseobacter sp. WL0113]MCV3272826.1 GntR family transcriptional regulator [Roseobacter sp. WL0113]